MIIIENSLAKKLGLRRGKKTFLAKILFSFFRFQTSRLRISFPSLSCDKMFDLLLMRVCFTYTSFLLPLPRFFDGSVFLCARSVPPKIISMTSRLIRNTSWWPWAREWFHSFGFDAPLPTLARYRHYPRDTTRSSTTKATTLVTTTIALLLVDLCFVELSRWLRRA